MAAKKAPKQKQRTGIEWVGGMAILPTEVSGEETGPFRPEVMVWLGADGMVLGTTIGKPGELLPQACETLEKAIQAPLTGSSHAPARVRVASPELAQVLREGNPLLEVVCAPTPELDEVMEALASQLEERESQTASYLSGQTDPAAVASLFGAAAELFRAAPWRHLPPDDGLCAVTIEALELQDAVVSIVGQAGPHPGFLVFDSMSDLEAYIDVGEGMAEGESPEGFPPHIALSFEALAALSPQAQAEIAEHAWPVAAAGAHPWVLCFEEDAFVRPAGPGDYARAEAIARALAELAAAPAALRAAFEEGGAPIDRTLSVSTHGGAVSVRLRAPYARDLPADLLGALGALAEDPPIDPAERERLEDELLRQFSASPEGAAFPQPEWVPLAMSLADAHLSETVATLEATELEAVLFELFPRKVSVEASAAGLIIEELRAFYAFLKRQYGLPQADDCLGLLGPGAADELSDELSDESVFDPAKAVVMAGIAAGYDMSTQEGVEAWMRVASRQPQRRASAAPPRAPRSKTAATARAKKTQRKAASKARKHKR